MTVQNRSTTWSYRRVPSFYFFILAMTDSVIKRRRKKHGYFVGGIKLGTLALVHTYFLLVSLGW